MGKKSWDGKGGLRVNKVKVTMEQLAFASFVVSTGGKKQWVQKIPFGILLSLMRTRARSQ